MPLTSSRGVAQAPLRTGDRGASDTTPASPSALPRRPPEGVGTAVRRRSSSEARPVARVKSSLHLTKMLRKIRSPLLQVGVDDYVLGRTDTPVLEQRYIYMYICICICLYALQNG